jgi:hypothetical protein
MERRIPVILLSLLLAAVPVALKAQELPQSEHIQLMLWADLDAYPETAAAEKTAHPDDSVFSYPVRRLKELAPYLLTGMVYGWNYEYTPSDKLRGVSEYFECTEIHPLGDDSRNIVYKMPWIENNRMYCWVEFTRTPAMLESLNYWKSIVHPKIQGSGKGAVLDGFDGIQDACRESVKNAVREYYRKEIKNKPKLIMGKVLINGVPRLAMDSGRYVVELDFFLETGRIIKYTQF